MAGQILQMLPADGWFAAYRFSAGPVIYKRVICWALVEGEIFGMVPGMGVTLYAGGEGFDGYLHESELPKPQGGKARVKTPSEAMARVEESLIEAIRVLGSPTLSDVALHTLRDRSNCYRQLKKLVAEGKVEKLDEQPTRYRVVS